jgi:hypothetical protein
MRLFKRRLRVIARFLLVSLGAFFLTAPATGLAASITPVIGAIDRNTAAWQVRYAASGGAADAAFVYGAPGWTPLLGDWAGGGNEGIGEFDPNSATWYLRDTASAGGPTIAPFAFGGPHWKPVSGRWIAGSAQSGIGVFDPATATWYLRDTASPGAPSVSPFVFGAPGFVPLVGDWNGDGTDGIGVFDPATGTWYLRNSLSAGAPDYSFAFGPPAGFRSPGTGTATASPASASSIRTRKRGTCATPSRPALRRSRHLCLARRGRMWSPGSRCRCRSLGVRVRARF